MKSKKCSNEFNNKADDIVIICGPTAVGKTEIAIKIALDFDMEIVSCDSMQLYKYMDIGSAKPTKEELSMVPHHMIDILDPLNYKADNQAFSAAQYSEMVRKEIDDIISRGKVPLIVGGTGLYLDSIIYDIDFSAAPEDSSFRNELYQIAEDDGPEALHDMLRDLDPDSADRIHPNNIKRVVRAIEAARSGDKIKEFRTDFKLRPEYNPIIIGLSRDREELYQRINKRVDILVENGLLDEVKMLYDMGLRSNDYPMLGIGYKEILEYYESEEKGVSDVDLSAQIEKVKTNSRHYAKRQFTWFKRYEDIKWFDLKEDETNNVIEEIEKWLRTNLKTK